MEKNTIVLVILIILFLASAFLAFNYYTQTQKLLQERESLLQENRELSKNLEKYKSENRSLISQNNELSARIEKIQGELDRIERERNEYRTKYEEVSREKNSLVEEIKKLKQARVEMPVQKGEKEVTKVSDEYWQDVLQKKAEIQAQLEETLSQLKEKESKVNELEKKNEELANKISSLEKTKIDFEKKIEFNNRTIDILTKELVLEKEDKKTLMDEVDRLKEENVSLARDLKLTRKLKEDLEKKFSQLQDEKEILERKVKDMATILSEKALEMDALQRQLAQTISSAKKVMPKETKAVELPPIVINSEAQTSSTTTPVTLEGKILAVNEKENFVIIDLGSSSGVKPGDKFSVLRNGKKIGSLEVIESRKDISACDIKATSQRLKEGDFVRSGS